MNWFWLKLDIGKHEAPRVRFLWLLRFLYQVGFVWAWTVLTAIFLEIFGINNLLYLFLVDAWILLIGSYAAHFLFLRVKTNHFVLGTIFGTLLLIIIAWINRHNIGLFFASLILAKDLFYGQLNIALYRKNESLFSPVEAQRFMPVIDSAVTIGTIFAALVFLGLLDVMSTKMIVFCWALPLIAMAGLVFYSHSLLEEVPGFEDEAEETKNSLKEAKEAIKSIPFLRYLSVMVFLQMSLYTIIEFEFLKYVKDKAVHKEIHFDPTLLQASLIENFPVSVESVKFGVNEAVTHVSTKYFVQTTIATELGTLALIFGVIALFVQFFVASKVLQRFGVIYSMLLYFGGLIGTALTFLAGGINMKIVRGYEHGFEAIFESAYHLTFYSVFPKRRESVRHFLEGFVRPGGIILGVGLMITGGFFWEEPGAMLMVTLTGILMIMMIPMRRFYTKLSHQNLKTHQGIISKLHAVEVLSQKGHHQVVEILSQELLDTRRHPIVREKIVVTASKINDPSIIHAYLKILGSTNEAVELKIKILESSLKLSTLHTYWNKHAFSQHHLLEILKKLFAEAKNPYLKKLVIMNIFRHLPQDRVVPFFLEVLSTSDDDLQSVCLRSAGEIFADPELSYYIRQYLHHPNSKVRGYAITALWQFEDREHLAHLLDELLDSEDPKEVIAGIYAIGEVRDQSREIQLMRYIDHSSLEVCLHALIALAKLGNVNCVPYLIDILFGKDEALAQKAFYMLGRAPEILPILKKEIQLEVSQRVMEILVAEEVTHRDHFQRLSTDVRQYLKRLYRLAEKYDEVLLLEVR